MDFTFSHLYKHTAHQCKRSPNGEYLANVVGQRLVIRSHSQQLVILHVFECDHPINHFEWSPDSIYIAVASYSVSTVYVWSVRDTHWKAKITDSYYGIRRIRWTPDATSIICYDDANLRLSVWMLADRQVRYIKYPKFPDKGCEPSPNGKYFAVVEQRQGKDYIGIYSGSDLTVLQHFPTDTNDLEQIRWSPDTRFIAVWDNCLYYRLLIYRLDGHLHTCYQAYDHGLGIKCVSWSRDSQFLAIGSYDQKIRVLKTSNWKMIGEFTHTSVIKQSKTPIYKEAEAETFSYNTVTRRPFNIPILRPDYNIRNPKIGVGFCQFNADGCLLCSMEDSMPTTLWIWDMTLLTCCLIVLQKKNIRQAIWNPKLPNLLAMVCNTKYVYLINRQSGGNFTIDPLNMSSVDLNVTEIQWSADGKSLLLMDAAMFCLASMKIA